MTNNEDKIFLFILGFTLGMAVPTIILSNVDVTPSVVQEQLDIGNTTCAKLDSTLESYDQSEVTCSNGITFKF
jgi:hypothetical protein